MQDLEENGFRLPNGPILSSPKTLTTSVSSGGDRLAVDKTLALQDIIGLFNVENVNDLIVGAIGNAATDLQAYEAVGVDKNDIHMVSLTQTIVSLISFSNLKFIFQKMLVSSTGIS